MSQKEIIEAYMLFPILAWAAGFFGSLILSAFAYGACQAVRWVDDFEKGYGPNWWAQIFVGLCGRRWDGYHYRKERTGDCWDNAEGNLFTALASGVLAILVYIAYVQPLVVAILAVTALTIFLCRYVRRIHKKLNAHVGDKDAHK